MIVLIEKNDVLLENNFFNLQCPKIDIHQYKHVSLENCYIEFFEPFKRNTLIDFSFRLIDKSVGNPNQLIGSDFLEKSSKFVWVNFSSASNEYKIQCQSLEESLLLVRLTNPPEKIKKIRVALKFQ